MQVILLRGNVVAMSTAAATEARQWIDSLPPYTTFRTDAVPGPRSVVHPLLTRMLRKDRPTITRLARGLYQRQPPPVHPLYGRPHIDSVQMGRAYLPSGAGLAGLSALHAFGWTTQWPARTTFAVPYAHRGTTPAFLGRRPPRYVVRHNHRRLKLTWHEVSLLEACLEFAMTDTHNWNHAMHKLLLRTTGRRGGLLRRGVFLHAAETEPHAEQSASSGAYTSFEAVVKRLGRDLPAVLDRREPSE